MCYTEIRFDVAVAKRETTLSSFPERFAQKLIKNGIKILLRVHGIFRVVNFK